jgi:hypothetical protein
VYEGFIRGDETVFSLSQTEIGFLLKERNVETKNRDYLCIIS